MGLASILGLIIIGLLVYFGTVRKKPAGLVFYAGGLAAILLVLLVDLTGEGVIARVPHAAQLWLASSHTWRWPSSSLKPWTCSS
jgi:hypothetical protein